jgi:hypothetical protein
LKPVWMKVVCEPCGKEVFRFKCADGSMSLGLFEMLAAHMRTEHDQ